MQKKFIIGTAGTGKTSLLVQKVNQILARESPEKSEGEILVLVSSSYAAKDIAGRIPAFSVVIHTVRSLCEEALKDSNPELQILSDFRSWLILRDYITSAPLRSSYRNVKDKRSFINEMLELIQAAIMNSIPVDQIPSADNATDKLEDIKSIYKYYRDFCYQHNLVPSSEVIPRASSLLGKYSQRFGHIFIDQYEDFCPGEVRAIESLINNHINVTIFADKVRYSPMSATGSAGILPAPPLILQSDETEDISEYGRFSETTAGHINRLLGKAVYPQNVESHNDRESDDNPLTIAVEDTAIDEAEYIARTIKRIIYQTGKKYSDFAILCRELENFGRILQDILKKYYIPCASGIDLLHNHKVQFVLLCFQVVTESAGDDLVLKWLSSTVARLDRADVYRAYIYAGDKRQNFLKVVTEEADSLFHKSLQRLKEILSILDLIRSELRNGRRVWELVEPILIRSGAIDAGRLPHAISLSIEIIRDIEETYGEKRGFPAVLADIREGLARIPESDGFVTEDTDAVRIMSIWESRGLEFPFVFIPGMVREFFPARHPSRQLLYGEELGAIRTILRGIDLPGTISLDKWWEQERKLLYIAMTRAKEKLYLTFAHNYPESENCEPSPFLMDLLGGKEVSADNCAHYGINYQDRTISVSQGRLPALDNIISRSDLEVACYRYVKEMEQLDRQRAMEAINLLSGKGDLDSIIPPASMEEQAIPKESIGYVTHTSIRSFLACPRQYFLAHLLKVKTDYGASAHFGGLVHDVLAGFHSSYPELHNHNLEELWKEMRKILFDMWNGRVVDKSGRSVNYEAEFARNRLQSRSYLNLAQEILRAYLQAEYSRWDKDRSCIRTEDNFRFTAFGKYIIAGRIDRIDACASSGDEIIDFKTSVSDKEGESALKLKFLNLDDDPDYLPRDYQLPIYYLACLCDLNLNPKKLVIYQLRNFSSATNEPFRREIEILPDESKKSTRKDKFITKADLESVEDDILQTLDRMASGFYHPEPREDIVCEMCEFSFLCDREESNAQ